MKNASTNRKYHVKDVQFISLRAAIEMGLSYAVPPVIMVSEPSSDGDGRDWVTCTRSSGSTTPTVEPCHWHLTTS